MLVNITPILIAPTLKYFFFNTLWSYDNHPLALFVKIVVRRLTNKLVIYCSYEIYNLDILNVIDE